MERLVGRIAAAVGVEPRAARLAAGHVLGYFLRNSPKGPAAELVDKMPGAREAIAAAAAQPYKSGMFRSVLGGVGSLLGGSKGDVLVLTAKLTSMGFSTDQLQRLAKEIFYHAEGIIGRDKLRVLTDPIPGLSQFLWPKK